MNCAVGLPIEKDPAELATLKEALRFMLQSEGVQLCRVSLRENLGLFLRNEVLVVKNDTKK